MWKKASVASSLLPLSITPSGEAGCQVTRTVWESYEKANKELNPSANLQQGTEASLEQPHGANAPAPVKPRELAPWPS